MQPLVFKTRKFNEEANSKIWCPAINRNELLIQHDLISNTLCSLMEALFKGYILYNSTYLTLFKNKMIGTENS